MRVTLRRSLAAFFGVVFALSTAAAYDLPSPAIRDFDIATIEKLGREIYEQDQWAWKATDVAFAQRSESERRADGLKGWITGFVDGSPRVRFVGGTGDKLEALYDVVFDAAGNAAFSIPADRTLSGEEIAQHDARALARSGANNKCSNTYNTVALKDPAGDGWLVWALAATTDADAIIFGGHMRFTVSADGKTVTTRDALSKGCTKFSRREIMSNAKEGAELAGLMLSHVVSLTPVETHVFAQLSYQIKIVISTLDGRAWKLDAGRVTNIDMDMAGFEGFAARIMAGFAEHCRIIASIDNADPKKFVTADAPSMILATEGEAPFKLKMPSGYTAESVICGRLEIVPAPNDYKVVVAGYPLHILDIGAGHPQRMGVLEMDAGRFRFRMTDGPALTDDLIARVGKRLDGFQNAVQAKTVSLMSAPIETRGGSASSAARFGNTDAATANARRRMDTDAPTERYGYATGGPNDGYSFQLE